MPITDLNLAPEFAGVGQQVTCVPVGTPAGQERRYYLLSAPPGSTLVTLATYEGLGKKLSDARLKVDGSGQGLFTPDVSGVYKVIVRDITVYRFVPHYGGHVPASGEATELDNEEAALPSYAGGTAQASDVPSGGVAASVYERKSRTIGFGQDTATLSLACQSGGVVSASKLADSVRLTPGPTAPARIAVYNARVLNVLDVLASEGRTSNLPLCRALLPSLVAIFNEHAALSGYRTHGAADSTHALASTAAVSATAASLQARLDDIVAKYNLHRVMTSSSVHNNADATNVMHTFTIADDGDVTNAVRYFEHVYGKLFSHATDTYSHDNSVANNIVDGYFGWLAEPPTTMAEVADAINGAVGSRWQGYSLTSLYEAHRIRVNVDVHHGSGVDIDLVNSVAYLGGSTAELITTANALANALSRHVQNQDAAGAEATTPYHYTEAKKSRLPATRANDGRSLAILIEELWLCMESHLWSAGPPAYTHNTTAGERGQHGDRVWGLGALLQAPDSRPPRLLWLQKAWEAALSPSADVPDGLNGFPALLSLDSGFS